MEEEVFYYNKMKTLDKPIEFPVTIYGKKMNAKVIAIGHNKIDDVFEVSFSDGHRALFYLNDEGLHAESPDSKFYADAIAEDMNILVFYQQGKLLHNFRHTVKKEVNIWVQESSINGEPATYAVHYFGHCQFWVHKVDGVWMYILPNVSDNEREDPELLRQIGFLLDSLL